MKQPSVQFEKAKRCIVGTYSASKLTAEEKLACAIKAIRNGWECEACE